ncbi:SGNH/GDSL hydrolase family protein [Sessilibacter corallicola]
MDFLSRTTRLVRFFHPDKRLDFLPGKISDEALASFFEANLEEFSAIKDGFKENVCLAAKQLVEKPNVVTILQQLPLENGNTVVVVGDSLSDDYQSWFEILTVAYKEVTGKTVNWINLAHSGDTSMQTFASLGKVKQLQPDLTFCFIGTNDSRIHANCSKHCTSLSESFENLKALKLSCEHYTKGSVIFLPPVGVDEDRISNDWLLTAMNAKWDNAHLKSLGDFIVDELSPVIDIRSIFNGPNAGDMFLEDGLHWSLDGQLNVAEKVILNLGKLVR